VHQYRRSQFAAAMSGWTHHDRETFADLLTRFITALGQPDGGMPAAPASGQRENGEDPGDAGRTPAIAP
jgi:hypothetical protein